MQLLIFAKYGNLHAYMRVHHKCKCPQLQAMIFQVLKTYMSLQSTSYLLQDVNLHTQKSHPFPYRSVTMQTHLLHNQFNVNLINYSRFKK